MSISDSHIRKQFPALHQLINKRQLVYLDNAATTQKPQLVIDRINHYYSQENSNIHRGAHFLSNKATEAYEQARKTIQAFLNAPEDYQIIFTRGTTESINLVAQSFSKKFVGQGDEIIVSAMEHHSNIVPWQMACEDRGAIIRVIPMNQEGELDMLAFRGLVNDKTRIIAVTHVSNSLGTVNPVEDIIAYAHQYDIPVLIDGAQAIPHMPVDVRALDCDFYCLSGHKMYGPMGVGVLYGKEEWLEKMPPWQGGGEMIKSVSFEKTTYNELPFKFEAGTPNVGDVLGLESAILFLKKTGREWIARHEEALLQYALAQLGTLDKIRFIGTARKRTGVISFLFEDIHPYDTGTILDKMGIAVRTGHHCAQPVMDFFGIPGTVRISLALYNTKEEIDTTVQALKTVREMFGS
jgi:cysteine desulfurase / selenocysteine lyase